MAAKPPMFSPCRPSLLSFNPRAAATRIGQCSVVEDTERRKNTSEGSHFQLGESGSGSAPRTNWKLVRARLDLRRLVDGGWRPPLPMDRSDSKLPDACFDPQSRLCTRRQSPRARRARRPQPGTIRPGPGLRPARRSCPPCVRRKLHPSRDDAGRRRRSLSTDPPPVATPSGCDTRRRGAGCPPPTLWT